MFNLLLFNDIVRLQGLLFLSVLQKISVGFILDFCYIRAEQHSSEWSFALLNNSDVKGICTSFSPVRAAALEKAMILKTI